MRVTAAQVAAYARGAGWPEDEVITAVAVAIAENRGSWDGRTLAADALGDVGLQTAKWGPSVGLWQVRSLTAAHRHKGSPADAMRDQAKLTDPAYNAAAAHAIWAEARGWRPWSTYPGFALMYSPTARAAVASSPAAAGPSSTAAGVVPVGFLGDAADAAGAAARAVSLPLGVFGGIGDTLGAAKAAVGLLGRLVEFVAKAGAWLGDGHNWVRVFKVWAGTWLTVLGLLMFGWPAISKGAGVAANFIPAGKVAKTAAGAAGAGKAARAATVAKGATA